MSEDIEHLVRRWREDAAEDMDLARRILEMKKPARAMFFAHLALEKALKALVIRVTEKTPPKIHNLLILAERADVRLDDKRQMFLSAMNHYQIAGRYSLTSECGVDSSSAAQDLQVTERMFEWLIDL